MVGARTPGAPLLERERELAAITAAIDGTAGGRGRTIWIEGPAGIGKTRLLRAARDHALQTGVRVLWAQAGALEHEFAFGVVRTLFEPAVTERPALLTTGPARLAAGVVTLAEDTSTAISAARLHGLYWLTVGLADDGPLLVVVDDAHWADGPSLEALAYLARRVVELPVVILLAARSEAGGVPVEVIRGDPETLVLHPGPLSNEGCAQLVRAALGDPTPAFRTACHDAAEGNPLLLNALLAALKENDVLPDDAGVDAVRQRAPAIVATFILPRLRHLPPQAVALARAVAVLGSAAELRRAATLADLDPGVAVEAADALVVAKLLAPGRPLTFTHPLFAEAIAGHMSAAERHRGHARAARCLAEEGADPERVAAHLLVVERLGDPWVVAGLRAAAAVALAKGAPGSSVGYLRRAIAEPCRPAELPDLLLDLGTAQVLVADDQGYRTLRAAWELTSDPRDAARVALAVSRAARGGGVYRPAEEIVVAAVSALGDGEPDLLAELHTELAMVGRIGNAPGWPTSVRVDELAELAGACGDEATSLALRLAALNALRDPAAGPAAAAIAARAAELASRTEVVDASALYAGPCITLIATEQPEAALTAAEAAFDSAQHGGRLDDFGVAVTMRAHVRFLLGRLRQAEEDAGLADRLCAGFDPQVRRHTQAWLVHCLVERGEAAEAERRLLDSGVPVTLAHLLLARARVRLALDRPADALADLGECRRRLRHRNVLHPNFAPWQAWSAVALLRLGRGEEARVEAAEALAAGRAFGSARAEGVALWAAGLVEQSADVLADAVTVLRRVPAPLERARALVDLGAVLRRADRRRDARTPLQEALQIAHECGADALAGTARLELAAVGVHARRPAVTGPDSLTPSERRVADLAAGGASNREIAQALFVSPRTVENHLGNVYRKLGAAGRTDLPAALATTP